MGLADKVVLEIDGFANIYLLEHGDCHVGCYLETVIACSKLNAFWGILVCITLLNVLKRRIILRVILISIRIGVLLALLTDI